jgi:hypothetical protein
VACEERVWPVKSGHAATDFMSLCRGWNLGRKNDE